MRSILIMIFTILGIYCLPAFATLINIPDDYSTIQEGIDASSDGDTVLVASGTYTGDGNRDIDFNGKAILLISAAGPDSTIIDCDGSEYSPHRGFYFHGDENSSSIVYGFTITDGYADDFGEDNYIGGGILCINGSSPLIVNCQIKSNYADRRYAEDGSFEGLGGGIACFNSSPIILRCIFEDNWAENGWSDWGEPPDTFYAPGGAIYSYDSEMIIENCILYNNSAGIGAGIWAGGTRSPEIVNTIIWNNFPEEVSGTVNIQYSDIRGGWEGEGNIDVDPLFRDPENGDFHLMATYCGDPYDSPCIDAGDPITIDSLLDCSWGLGGIRSDMGAYCGGDSVQVGLEDQITQIPISFALLQNYPNPFNASTVIRYDLPYRSQVTIDIYDILGRKVEKLQDGLQSAGQHQVIWKAGDLPSGMYFYRIVAGDHTESRKMLLLK